MAAPLPQSDLSPAHSHPCPPAAAHSGAAAGAPDAGAAPGHCARRHARAQGPACVSGAGCRLLAGWLADADWQQGAEPAGTNNERSSSLVTRLRARKQLASISSVALPGLQGVWRRDGGAHLRRLLAHHVRRAGPAAEGKWRPFRSSVTSSILPQAAWCVAADEPAAACASYLSNPSCPLSAGHGR